MLWFIQACTKLINLLSDEMTIKEARDTLEKWEDKERLDVYVDIAVIPLLTERDRQLSGTGSNQIQQEIQNQITKVKP